MSHSHTDADSSPLATFVLWFVITPAAFFLICPFFFCMTAAHQVNSNANFANFDAFGNTAIPSHLNTSPPSKSLSSGTLYPSIAFLPYCHPLLSFFMCSIQGLACLSVSCCCWLQNDKSVLNVFVLKSVDTVSKPLLKTFIGFL